MDAIAPRAAPSAPELGRPYVRVAGVCVCAPLPVRHPLAPTLCPAGLRAECTASRVQQGKREDRSCPPRLEELKKEAQGIMNPDIFDGARFEFNKTLTQKFQLNHNITLGSSQVPPCRLAAMPPCRLPPAACRHAVCRMPQCRLPPCRHAA